MREFALLFVVFLVTEVIESAEADRKVTVVTRSGETIEGLFGGATNEGVSIKIAGQSLNMPISDLRYISFVGDIESIGATDPDERDPLQRAMDSIRDLNAAIEIGLLRDQYAEKLQENLPIVNQYLEEPGDDWPDVQIALGNAVSSYKKPLSDVEAWSKASTSLHWAGSNFAYAEDVLENVEPDARQDDATQSLNLGDTVSGRLGFGDAIMPESLDRSTTSAFNDVYTFRMVRPGKIIIEAESTPSVSPHITLLDPSGKKIEGDQGYSSKVTTKKNLKSSGEYTIWIGAGRAGTVGAYRMTLSLDN